MMERIFKRKLYDRLLEWKRVQNGKSAILVEGARRVGKSTLVETFARNEYESYILIDFNEASDEVKSLFNNLMDKNFLFLQLQSLYKVILKERKSVIISTPCLYDAVPVKTSKKEYYISQSLHA